MHIAREPSLAPVVGSGIPEPERPPAPKVTEPPAERPLEPPVPLPGSSPQPEPPALPLPTDPGPEAAAHAPRPLEPCLI
jgi:hypothetical protein